MAEKKTFVLRVDNNIYKALEKWAEDEFRSVNGQIEWIISQKLKETGRIKPEQASKAEAKNQNKKEDK
ncbi:MAG: Arc family DNA-binding protein [Agriterribacter sp.]